MPFFPSFQNVTFFCGGVEGVVCPVCTVGHASSIRVEMFQQ